MHNPVGPLDFGGVYDEHSDRMLPLAELIDRGYGDAYRQFIEPIVGAGGERIEAVRTEQWWRRTQRPAVECKVKVPKCQVGVEGAKVLEKLKAES